MIPSSGQMNVSNAASTRAGLASQIMNNPSRGKSPANMANRQPILLTSHLLSQCPPRGSYWRIAYRRPALTLSLETCKPSYLWGLSSAVLGASSGRAHLLIDSPLNPATAWFIAREAASSWPETPPRLRSPAREAGRAAPARLCTPARERRREPGSAAPPRLAPPCDQSPGASPSCSPSNCAAAACGTRSGISAASPSGSRPVLLTIPFLVASFLPILL